MPKKKLAPDQYPEEREISLDQTDGYEIIIEQYLSGKSVNGLDSGYGIRNKRTGVVEMRWGAYSEALQGLMLLQENLDKFQGQFEKKQGKLN